MLLASSKRAFTSTTTVTSFCAAASIRALTMGEFSLVRYSVCLIDRTLGSSAARADEIHHRVVGVVRMMQQDVAMANLLEDVLRLAIQLQLARHKRLEFQVGPVRLLVEMKQSRKIHRPVGAIDLPVLHLEVAAQALDHLGIGVGLNLQAHGIALAPVMQLGAHATPADCATPLPADKDCCCGSRETRLPR